MCDQLTKSDTRFSQSSVESEYFNIKSFGKDVLTYGFSQFLLLVCAFINFLILPKLLSVEDYGHWRLFMLYGSYVGILHFGFLSGILIRWAGKQLADVEHEISGALKFLLIEQTLIILPLIIILYFIDVSLNFFMISVLIYAFFVNLTTFFTCTSQAVKKFKILSAMNVLRSVSFLILIIVVLLIFNLKNYYYVIMAQIVSFCIILIFFILHFQKYIFKSNYAKFKKLFVYGKKNISIGIFLLIGNFSAVLFITIDQLVVSANFVINEFAIYAFALNIAGIIYIFLGAISQVFFPYLAGLNDDLKNQLHNYLKPMLILSWAAILTIYFPSEKFIEYYLPKYITSLPIMQILLATVGFGSLIQILQINYYKAYKKLKRYFLITISMLGLSFVLNIAALMIIGSLKSIAGATLLSFGIWYLTNEIVLKKTIKQTWREIVKPVLVICCFILAFFSILIYIQSYFYQMIIYIIFYLLIVFIFYKSFIKLILSQITHYFLLKE